MDRIAKLSLYLQACEATPFGFGVHDCCTFSFGAVMVQTDRDLIADVPRYTTKRQAAAVLKAGGGLESMVTQRLGEPIPVKTAQRGDVVLFDVGPHGPALGVCVGAQFAATKPDGLGYFPMRHARMAWMVA